jgi:hypothetical protein
MATQYSLDKRSLAFGKVQGEVKTYLPLLVDASGQLLISHDTEISHVNSADVAIVGGIIAPLVPESIIGELNITGEGDTDDDLDTITSDSTFTGKILILRKSGSGTITVKRSASLLLDTADFILNSVDDNLMLIWKSANIWREISRSDNA